MSVSVVIAAYNEAASVGATVRAALSLPGVREVIVVDDASTDETARAARQAGAVVVSHKRNRGKGAAVATGLARAASDTILLIDADLGETAAAAEKLIRPVVDGSADMAIAAFPVRPGRGGGMGLVKTLARRGIRWLTGKSFEEPLSGQRAFRRQALLDWQPSPGWGLEVGMTVDACRRGLRVVELPLDMDHRVTGRSWRDVLHRARQLRDVTLTLARKAFGGPGAPLR